ncbi:hypothetical protein LIN78_06075 [Leeia sp. TBRC 13508]|uniref:DUF3828 domain-containing protein n=1 Tax=Leeia speluncae TaxID=2884804 RepID=A0ABS8D4I9_9NEIS|nr:hypothetical protein [Leeia speluncae]MCB6183110.1 hypothetical protein [Leeia speluncae]
MIRIHHRLIGLIVFFSLPSVVQAACQYMNALEFAKAAWQQGDALLDNVKWLNSNASKPLNQLLAKERQCAKSEVCAIDASIWTGGQDGEAYSPISYQQTNKVGSAAVKIRYRFGFGVADAQKTNRTSIVHAVQQASGCWQLTDIVDRDGNSLVRRLEGYYGK